jgi:hypothetical protein
MVSFQQRHRVKLHHVLVNAHRGHWFKVNFRHGNRAAMPFAIGRAADKGPHLNTYTNFVCSWSSTKEDVNYRVPGEREYFQ